MIENSKKITKKFKKLKNTNVASFQAKIGGERMRNRENKNYRFVSFLPEFQKNLKILLWIHFMPKLIGEG